MADKKKSSDKSDSSGEDTVQGKNTVYETPQKVRRIKDKTGWEVLPENKAVFGKKGD